MKLPIFSTALCISAANSLKNDKYRELLRKESSRKSDTSLPSNISARIVGGHDADASQYPFFAWWNIGCGATLIHADLLLTAAHCINEDNYHDWANNVWIGELEHRDSKAVQRSIVGVSRYPTYSALDSVAYDFMVLLLDEPTPSSFEPVSLNSDPDNPGMGDILTGIGFGTDAQKDFEQTSLSSSFIKNDNENGKVSLIHNETYTLPDGSSISTFDFAPWEDGTEFSAVFGTYRLYEVDMPYVSHESCNLAYEGLLDEDSMFCAGVYNKDTCTGDSGGPLLDSSGTKQVGVTSFGRGCGDANYPGVYSRISFAHNWIEGQICLNTRVQPLPIGCSQPRFELHVNIVHDLFPHETGWLLGRGDSDYGRLEAVLAVPAGTTNRLSNTDTRVVNLDPGSYTFMILDEAGDGLCCQWGEGSFALSDSFGNTIQHNGRFQDSHTARFEISESGELTEISQQATNDSNDEGPEILFPPVNDNEDNSGTDDCDDCDDSNASEPEQLSALALCENAMEVIVGGEPVQDATIFGTLYNVGDCGASTIANQGVWFRVTGTGTVLLASTCSIAALLDTQISVFTGGCNSLRCIDGNDDACSLQSEVTWDTKPGQFYYVVVHSWIYDPIGDFELIVSEARGDQTESHTQPQPQDPGEVHDDNDSADDHPDDDPQQLSALALCESAAEVIIGEPVQDATIFGTLYNVGECGGSTITNQGVWFRVTGTGAVLLASTCSFAALDTQISVFTGECNSLSCIDGNDDSCLLQSEVTWATKPGQVDYVVVHGWIYDPVGDFELMVLETGE